MSTLHRKHRILVIDDEPEMLKWLTLLFDNNGFDVRASRDGQEVSALVNSWRPDAAITDLRLPGTSGMEMVQCIKGIDVQIPVIMLTGQGDIPSAVEAVKAGAFDFLEKPVNGELLLDKVNKAIRQSSLAEENERLAQKLSDDRSPRGVIGTSEQMRKLFELVDCVAPSDANVLIVGENGSGKELIANAIHQASHRAKRPLIKINCAAIPAELIESELFGHRKGAFTGAVADKDGLFKMADGGSLLLDEIGEMPPYLQTKLLRVLQERAYRPIGGDASRQVDFRLICATNIDVDAALASGQLREDLYFRVNTITLRVPPLRERLEDLPLLVEHFLRRFRQQYQRNVTEVSAEAYQLLSRHHWPGNVRELEHVIERAVLVAKESEVLPADLPEGLRDEVPAETDFEVPEHRTLEEIEKMAIVQALERAGWNKVEAAETLGVYRPTLYSKMKKYGIKDGRLGSRGVASGADAELDERAVEVGA